MSFPQCFDSYDQFRYWKQAARRCKPGHSSYCTDCTPGYQERMIAQDRCSHPGTTFPVGARGGLDGRRVDAERVGKQEVA